MSHAAKRRAQARRTGTDEPASQRKDPYTTRDELAPEPSDKDKDPDLGILNDQPVLQLLEDIRADQQALRVDNHAIRRELASRTRKPTLPPEGSEPGTDDNHDDGVHLNHRDNERSFWTSRGALYDWYRDTYHKFCKTWAANGAIMEGIITNFELVGTRLLRICPVCNKAEDKKYGLAQEHAVLRQQCPQCGFHVPILEEIPSSYAVFKDVNIEAIGEKG
ncbi:hypothetical protein DV736_g6660, partial [Chaetothyriales sp. CBS 134916]